MPTLDIFSGTPDDDAVWVCTVRDLKAKHLIQQPLLGRH